MGFNRSLAETLTIIHEEVLGLKDVCAVLRGRGNIGSVDFIIKSEGNVELVHCVRCEECWTENDGNALHVLFKLRCYILQATGDDADVYVWQTE